LLLRQVDDDDDDDDAYQNFAIEKYVIQMIAI
jgi:hypothetical protein